MSSHPDSLFTGKERDTETGLDYFGARYYSSDMGRFTSPDQPFADQHTSSPQSWNLYAYTRNNPLKYIDSDGQALDIAPELKATVAKIAEESPAFKAELDAHDGADKPDLAIRMGETANDPSGLPTDGVTDTTFSKLGPGHMDAGDEEGVEYGYVKSTIIINTKSTQSTEDVLEHEMGHVFHNRNNPTKSARESNHTKRTKGATPWAKRPEEVKANAFQNRVKKQRKEEQKRRGEEKKKEQRGKNANPDK